MTTKQQTPFRSSRWRSSLRWFQMPLLMPRSPRSCSSFYLWSTWHDRNRSHGKSSDDCSDLSHMSPAVEYSADQVEVDQRVELTSTEFIMPLVRDRQKLRKN